jgi:ABC-type sugar transport system ATPase subunit
MSAYDNIAFGLRVKQVDRAEIDSRVRALAEAMHISALLDKRPGQCSGAKHRESRWRGRSSRTLPSI